MVSIVVFLVGMAMLCMTSAQNNDDRIVCYYTNWTPKRPEPFTFSPEKIDPNLCTHLIYAFAQWDLKNDNIEPSDVDQDVDQKGYERFAALRDSNPSLVLLVALGGSDAGSTSYSVVAASDQRRKRFAKNVVAFLKKWKFDGINLDWQHPTFKTGGTEADYANYVQLVKALKDEFEIEAKNSGERRFLIVVDVPAVTEIVDEGYDLINLQMYSDFINVLCYDYHYSYDPIVNHHSPLYPLREEVGDHPNVGFNVDATIKYLIGKGLKPKNMNLGIPSYGRTFDLVDEKMYSIGSPSKGEGLKGAASKSLGYITFNEACKRIKSENFEVVWVNRTAMGPYAHKGVVWVSYDDEASAYNKVVYASGKKALEVQFYREGEISWDVKRDFLQTGLSLLLSNRTELRTPSFRSRTGEYARKHGLGGIVYWTIDNDDFTGNCTGTPFAFIKAGKSGFFSLPKKMRVTTIKQPTRSQIEQMTLLNAQTDNPTPPMLSPAFGRSSRKELHLQSPTSGFPQNVYIWVTNNVYNFLFDKDSAPDVQAQHGADAGMTNINV